MCPPTPCLVKLALRYLRDSLLRLGAQYIVPFRPRLSWSAASRRAGAPHAAAACGFLGLTRQGPPTDPVPRTRNAGMGLTAGGFEYAQVGGVMPSMQIDGAVRCPYIQE